jgi:hypothetical protein
MDYLLAHLIELVIIGYIGGVCVSDTIDIWLHPASSR